MKNFFTKNFLLFSLLLAFTLSAFGMRFYHLDQPNEVVFDEYHFFHFVADYEKGEYFFDIHPPLGKLILWGNAKLYGVEKFAEKALAEQKFREDYLKGEKILSKKIQELEKNKASKQEILYAKNQYDDLYNMYLKVQSKPFETYTIGTEYDESLNIWGIRSLPALFGALLIPLVFLGIFFLTGSVWGASLSALFFIFEPSFLVESRFVLMDSMLLFFIIASFFSSLFYLKNPSWKWWWAVIITTSFAASIKWTGFSTIGIAGIVLLISTALEYKKETKNFLRDFFAKAFVFWVFLLSFYTLSFAIHFAAVPNSGKGDVYHSTAFRQTLGENKISSDLEKKSFWINPNGEFWLPQKKEKKNIKTGEIEIITDWESWILYGKFFEINRVMGDRNASIRTEHPYSSTATHWLQGKNHIFYWNGESKILPNGEQTKQEIHLFANPFVWIISYLSVFGIILFSSFQNFSRSVPERSRRMSGEKMCGTSWSIYFILLLAILANILPYFLVERPAFLYHAFPSVSLGMIALGVLFAEVPHWKNYLVQKVFLVILFLLLLGFFIFEIPLIYGESFLVSEMDDLFFWR